MTFLNRRVFHICLAIALCVVSSGCAARPVRDRGYISDKLSAQSGYTLRASGKPGELLLPPGVMPGENLSRDAAVAIALWNNAELQAALAELGFSRAELADAGLLHNPVFSVLFPLGPKQLEFAFTAPFEALWQRPRRVAIAKLNAESLAERLVQHGLALVAEVRIACADIASAQARVRFLTEAASLESEIAKITEARFRAGDISEMEVNVVRARAQRSGEDAKLAQRELALAREKLRNLLGLSLVDFNFNLAEPDLAPMPTRDAETLVKVAMASRPDLRAAELQLEVAGRQAGLERSQAIALAGILDANGAGKEGFEAGPGLAAAIPFFRWNQPGILRAQANVEIAANRYAGLKQRIARQVRESETVLRQAHDSYQAYMQKILPSLVDAVRAAERAYSLGAISYLEVLTVSRDLVEAKLRAATLRSEADRAATNLELSVGKRL